MKDFISTCKQVIPFLLILAIGHFSKKDEWAVRRSAHLVEHEAVEAQENTFTWPIPTLFGFAATAQAEAMPGFTPPPVLESGPQYSGWLDSLHLTRLPYLRGNLLVDQEHYAGAANKGAKGKPLKDTKQLGSEKRRDNATQSHSGSIRFNIPEVAR